MLLTAALILVIFSVTLFTECKIAHYVIENLIKYAFKLNIAQNNGYGTENIQNLIDMISHGSFKFYILIRSSMASTSKRVSFNEQVVSHGPAPYPSVNGMAPHSMSVKCPKCRQRVDTLANKHPGLIAFFSGALMFIFGCVCCAWIPCVMESCQDVKHTCPNCGSYLGHYTAYLD